MLNAVVGFAGLPATLAALEAGKRLALANKESLIAAGPVVAKARAVGGGEIVPVDSEHSAVWQALRSGRMSEVRRIVLTASGGPFRGRTAAELRDVAPADALAHPTWNMGAKITIDSSTLMNKGLEVIEAHELFGVDFDRSTSSSTRSRWCTAWSSSSTARRSRSSRCPTCACRSASRSARRPGSPRRSAPSTGPRSRTLTFEPPDRQTFRALDLAYEAGRTGGTAPAVLSAANEVAVEAFLAGRIGWHEIAETVAEVLARGTGNAEEVADVLDADRVARERAAAVVTDRSRG